MVGHIEQTGQIVSMQFRRGHIPPAKGNLDFIQQCEAALPEGVRVNRLRIDAAGYQHAILDYAFDQGMAFAIRAKLTSGCHDLILSRPEGDWQPLIHRDGRVSTHQSTCRMTHIMNESKQLFTLIVQRVPKGGQQSIPVTHHEGVESIEHGGYLYRAIATNRDDLTDSELIHWYNQRAEHSENRIKELKHDFAGDVLPCSEFKTNELYFALCGLMRQLLPIQWAQSRVTTIRGRLYDLAAKIVYHGRSWIIKLQQAHKTLLEEALQSLRQCQFSLPP